MAASEDLLRRIANLRPLGPLLRSQEEYVSGSWAMDDQLPGEEELIDEFKTLLEAGPTFAANGLVEPWPKVGRAAVR